MKKRMMVFVLVAGMTTACSKHHKNNVPTINEPATTVQAVADPFTGTRNNPYDDSGIRHNAVLASLRDYQNMTGDITKASMKKVLLQEVRLNYGVAPRIDLDKVDALFQQVQKTSLPNFLAVADLNDRAKAYLLRLNELIKNVKHPDLFPSFLSRIAELEQEIMKDDLLQHEKASLLCMASITYHSGLYWKKVHDDNTWLHPTDVAAKVRWWQWSIVTHADFIGGLVGFLLGGDRDEIETSSEWMSGGAEGLLGS